MILVRWSCRKCGRSGRVAIVARDPKHPGIRAMQGHQAQNPKPGEPGRCNGPSLTWKIAEPNNGDEKVEPETGRN